MPSFKAKTPSSSLSTSRADSPDVSGPSPDDLQPGPNPASNPVPPVDILPPEVRDFVLSLPPDKRQQATRVLIQITRTTSHVGPIPSADALAQYGQVLPTAPDRILRMAEKQADHHMELEKLPSTAKSIKAASARYWPSWCPLATSVLPVGWPLPATMPWRASSAAPPWWAWFRCFFTAKWPSKKT